MIVIKVYAYHFFAVTERQFTKKSINDCCGIFEPFIVHFPTASGATA